MTLHRHARAVLAGSLVFALAACGLGSGDSGLFHRRSGAAVQPTRPTPEFGRQERGPKTSILDLFRNSANPNTTVEVNKYIWNAALDVLNFLPIESVDPFTGVIVTGYGTPPGGGRAYRATVYVQDPALDARSLNVALVSRGGGAVAPQTAQAVEDAILTRARQLRVRDGKL